MAWMARPLVSSIRSRTSRFGGHGVQPPPERYPARSSGSRVHPRLFLRSGLDHRRPRPAPGAHPVETVDRGVRLLSTVEAAPQPAQLPTSS